MPLEATDSFRRAPAYQAAVGHPPVLRNPEDTFRALERIGYRGAISIEHEPEDYDPTAEVVENARILRGWLTGVAA